MTSIRYALLRRDHRGVVRIQMFDEFSDARAKAKYLQTIADARDVQATFYVKLSVTEEVQHGHA